MKIRIYFVVSLILAILGIVGIIIYYSIPNEKPHIFVILADDMGYNDIGYNNHKVITPHLDRLASQSIMFQNNYVQAMCTPSRFALMSGIYPFKAGMSHTVENALKPHCAPLNYKFVPEYLKTKGYKTHHIGKWHLGFCHKNCTAIKRGFDESYGFYNGYCGYYNHINVKNGYDFNFNNKIDRSANGTHLMELFDEYTKRTIQNHKPSLPLFMYFAYPTPHTPIESESKFYNMYNESKMSEHRKHYLALMTSMDHSVGNLVSSLKAKGMYHNSIIIFISDNGGEIFGPASNYPYRGSKLSLYEGGVRSTAFVHSPLYGKKQKYVYG
ncbi:N-sulfoglucosamine sulfohydrolase [Intoshia linei]|uniref:N-sulfoglucosamine sulfohydrolase n=1 Tax=Intoshia linei TaxID=1819745 RepID=A0A177B1I7_9BILA|nr:N-sulfoglucosamine sulfohydrolase [Intoshia linei]